MLLTTGVFESPDASRQSSVARLTPPPASLYFPQAALSALPPLKTNPPLFPPDNSPHVDAYDPTLWNPGAVDSIPLRSMKLAPVSRVAPLQGHAAGPQFYRVVEQLGRRGDAILKAWERLQAVDITATYCMPGMLLDDIIDFHDDTCILQSNAALAHQDLYDAWKDVCRPVNDAEEYDHHLFLSHSMFQLLTTCTTGLGRFLKGLGVRIDSLEVDTEEDNEQSMGGIVGAHVVVEGEGVGSDLVMGTVKREEGSPSEPTMSHGGIGGIGAAKEEDVSGGVAIKELAASSTRPRTRASNSSESEVQLPPGSHTGKWVHGIHCTGVKRAPSTARARKRSSKAANSGLHTDELASSGLVCTGIKRAPIVDLTT